MNDYITDYESADQTNNQKNNQTKFEEIIKVSKKAALYGFLIFLMSYFCNWALSTIFHLYKVEFLLIINLFLIFIFYLVFVFDTKPLFLDSVVFGVVCSITYIFLIFFIWVPLYGGSFGFYISNPLHLWTIVSMLGIPALFGLIFAGRFK